MNDSTLPDEINEYYERGGEHDRLTASANGRLEHDRTRDILRRLLADTPTQTIADIGGGTGVHARWLTADGHTVTLIDPVGTHITTAAAIPGVTAVRGDARDLPLPDATTDAALLLGPLYHLPDPADRHTALREAHRVTRPGGLVAAAAIGRFSPWLDGIRRGMLARDDTYAMLQAAANGEFRPRDHGLTLFTTAYTHTPDALRHDFTAAGLPHPDVYAVEGPAWLTAELADVTADPTTRERLMTGLRDLEREETLLGASSHLLAAVRV